MFFDDKIDYDREKWKKKLRAIIQYEIDMELVKSKADFARKYGLTGQKLNYYLNTGSYNINFIGKLCETYGLTSDYLIYDKKPLREPTKQFLPPLILRSEEE